MSPSRIRHWKVIAGLLFNFTLKRSKDPIKHSNLKKYVNLYI